MLGEFRQAVRAACVIASVHRLNLLPRFGGVVLIESGVVDGKVEELLARQPLFRDLWESLARGAGGVTATP